MVAEKTNAVYQVSLKVLIKKGEDFLFLKVPEYGLFDLPGGRIDEHEFKVPLEEIIAREVAEELGAGLKYKLGKPIFQFRRKAEINGAPCPCFLTVYEVEYISGDIQLSEEHASYNWINPRKTGFPEKSFFSKEERMAFETYFANLA